MSNWLNLINSMWRHVGLTEKGLEYVLRVVQAPPARNVSNATKRNIIVDYPSQKMGCTMEYESVNPEAASGILREADPLCIGHWLQPETIAVLSRCKDGSVRAIWRTYDALVLYPDRVELVECKTEEELLRLSVERPQLYSRDAKGRWFSPEGEAAVTEYGLRLVVVSSADINLTLVRNMSMLAEVHTYVPSSTSALDEVAKRVQASPEGISLADLIDSGGALYSKNDVFCALLKGRVFALLDACLLRDDRITLIFPSRTKAEAYRISRYALVGTEVTTLIFEPGLQFNWQNALYRVCSVGPDSLYIQHGNTDPRPISKGLLTTLIKEGEVRPLNTVVSSDVIHEALLKRWRLAADADNWMEACARAQFLMVLANNPTASPVDFGLALVDRRTILRWREKARDGELRFGAAVWGLLDAQRPGRQRAELPQVVLEEMELVLVSHYFTPDKKGLRWCWRILRNRLEKKGLRVPCYKSFARFLRRRANTAEAADKREGERSAYKFEGSRNAGAPPNWIKAPDYAAKIAHMDGKLWDGYVVDDETGELLGRAGITVITLPNLGNAPIGFSILFESPSYRSAVLALRDMLERRIEIPSFIIVDNGREFNNLTFDKLLATLTIAKVKRPPSSPRYSSQIESFFRTLDLELAHNMAGNTQPLSQVREMTRETKPDGRAVWPLGKLYAALEKYFFQLCWDAPSASLGCSPRAALERERLHTPDRAHRFVIPPELRKIAFVPEVKGATRVVQPGRGVYVDGYYYWHEDMRRPDVEREKVYVRSDPMDLYTAYVLLRGEWQECKALSAPELKNVTENTRRIQSLAIRRLRCTHAARREKTHGRKLGEFAESIHQEEAVLKAERKARAERQIKTVPPAGEDGVVIAKTGLPKMDFGHLRRKRI